MKKRLGTREGWEKVCEEVVAELEDWIDDRTPDRMAVPRVPGKCQSGYMVWEVESCAPQPRNVIVRPCCSD